MVDFEKIAEFLKKKENILFALLFGSAAKGQGTRLSDVDIGIYTKNDLPILGLGHIAAGLEKIAHKKIDLVILNDLYKRKPYFSFQVVSSSRLLFCKDEDALTDFKKNVYLYYLDTKPLIDMMNQSFNRRQQTDAFGERNYA